MLVYWRKCRWITGTQLEDLFPVMFRCCSWSVALEFSENFWPLRHAPKVFAPINRHLQFFWYPPTTAISCVPPKTCYTKNHSLQYFCPLGFPATEKTPVRKKNWGSISHDQLHHKHDQKAEPWGLNSLFAKSCAEWQLLFKALICCKNPSNKQLNIGSVLNAKKMQQTHHKNIQVSLAAKCRTESRKVHLSMHWFVEDPIQCRRLQCIERYICSHAGLKKLHGWSSFQNGTPLVALWDIRTHWASDQVEESSQLSKFQKINLPPWTVQNTCDHEPPFES